MHFKYHSQFASLLHLILWSEVNQSIQVQFYYQVPTVHKKVISDDLSGLEIPGLTLKKEAYLLEGPLLVISGGLLTQRQCNLLINCQNILTNFLSVPKKNSNYVL